MKKLCELISILFLPFLACTQEVSPDTPTVPDVFEERELVPVTLYLDVAPMEYVVDGKFMDTSPTKATAADTLKYNYKTETAADTKVYNVWILEFEQDGEEYVLKTKPTYVPNYHAQMKNNGGEWKSEPLTVDLPSTRNDCKVLFMANTGNPDLGFRLGTTLERFKEQRYAEMHTQIDLFGYDVDAGLWAPRLNGTKDARITTDTRSIGTPETPVQLKRAMAKIEIRVINESLIGNKPDDQRVHLRYVRVNNVQDRSFYYTNYSDYATSQKLLRPSVASTIDFSKESDNDWDMDTHVPADWNKIIAYSDFYHVTGANKGEPWEGAAPDMATILTGAVAPTNVLARFFVPGNVRAGIEGDATSVTLIGEYSQGGVKYQNVYEIPIRETTPDGGYCYAVRPNHHYAITVTIKQRGKTGGDYNDGLYDFTKKELANCYILQPPLSADLARGYKIPVEKPNHFWGDSRYEADAVITTSSSPIGEKHGRDLVIGETDDWWVEILWADFDFRNKVEFVRLFPNLASYTNSDDDRLLARGKGTDPLKTGCFAFRLYGGAKGNIAIAIKKRLYKDEDPSKYEDFIVWSWHFWITDYDPDSTPTFSASRLLGTVPGGKVWKMNNEFFTSPLSGFAGSYAMDRAIGVVDNPATKSFIDQFAVESVSDDIKYGRKAGLGLYYQFGRKDPLPGWCTVYYPDMSNATKIKTEAIKSNPTKNTRALIMSRFCTLASTALRDKLWYTTGSEQYSNKNVPFSVMYPLVGLKSNDGKYTWVWDEKYNPAISNAPILWNDPYFYEHDSNHVTDNLGHHKSIFDPCPPGWIIQPRQTLGTISNNYFYLDGIDSKSDGVNYDYWLITNTNYPGEYGPHGILIYPDGQPGTLTSSTYSQAIFFPSMHFYEYSFKNGYEGNKKFKNIYNWAGYPTDIEKSYRFNLSKGQNVDKSQWIAGEQYLYYQVRCLKNTR